MTFWAVFLPAISEPLRSEERSLPHRLVMLQGKQHIGTQFTIHRYRIILVVSDQVAVIRNRV